MHKVIRQSRVLDCFGVPTGPGVSAIICIRFSPSASSFVACEAEPPDNCMGPLQRMCRNEA